jgi:hypothetical protein
MNINDEFSAFLENLNLGKIHFYKRCHPYILSNCDAYRLITPISNGDGAETFRIELCPGDTIKQSRSLYAIDRKDELCRMEALGWKIVTNFHFAFMSQNLLWTGYQGNWIDYIQHWHDEYLEGNIRQYKRLEWDQLLEKLSRSRNMIADDIIKFVDRISKKAYPSINLCPSIRMTHNIMWKDLENDELTVYRSTRKLLEETAKALS